MAFLSDTDRQRITAAIKQAENATSGELVTVIARASDTYLFIPTLWAAMAALLVPLPLLLLGEPLSAWNAYSVQLGVFVLLVAAFRWRPICMLLIPKRVQRARAARLAREQFFEQGLYRTEGRTGVLIFVSIAEHYVEILADKGINDKVPAGAWEGIVGDFAGNVKADKVADGFVGAVEACGSLLAEHFPKPPGNTDELPNHLIEI